LLRNLSHLESRALSLRLDPARHPIPTDRRGWLLTKGLAAALWRARDLTLLERLAWAAYFTFVAVCPSGVLRQVLRGMRGASIRQGWARRLLALSRATRFPLRNVTPL
jgi:hypothetical protein